MQKIAEKVTYHFISTVTSTKYIMIIKNNHIMHITQNPGYKMMVDWNETTMCVFDCYIGESIKVCRFEATLLFGMLSYVYFFILPLNTP